MKILIVDDSPDALAIARARLAKEYVDILCADGGQAGLDIATREKPDLILLDVDMPDISGFEVCRRLKGDDDLRMIPVIFLSGSGDIEDKIRGLDLGAMDYITKPFNAFELRARVRAALRMKQMQDLLAEEAHIDPLTGLPNRRALTDRVNREWSRFLRHGGSLAVIMGDIDHFKQVNDIYGHAAGDRMLREVAKAIVGQCRETDLPGRYGGDEFVIVVPDETAVNASSLAERCRQAVQEIPFGVGSEMVGQTATFGVADTTNAGSPESLVTAADEALYQGKESGRNVVVVASGFRGAAVRMPEEPATMETPP